MGDKRLPIKHCKRPRNRIYKTNNRRYDPPRKKRGKNPPQYELQSMLVWRNGGIRALEKRDSEDTICSYYYI